ncbi:MAG: glycosyltransferase family 2 protein [Spartobacteria bacterium]|nr:glycosyltransferase family 2 protein [Spartobacteria bacterium]
MKGSCDISIVIPAYNEGSRIGNALAPTIDFLKEQSYTSEIIVVSDGSRDDTCQVSQSYSNRFSALRVLEYFPNRGKGYAVRHGMLNAKGQVCLFMDADYAVPISHVEKALVLLHSGYDLVIGSRGAEGARVDNKQSKLRQWASRLYTVIQNRWIGVSFMDTQCGFKAYKREAAQLLFSRQKLSSVIFDGELLFLAQRAGMRIGEFPVEWTHDPNSRITYNFWRSLMIFLELFKIRWLHRFGR